MKSSVLPRVDRQRPVKSGWASRWPRWCHTQYDPIYHEEYFELFAFFNQTEDADRGNDAPFIKPTKDQQGEIAKAKSKLDQARKALNDAGQKPSSPKDPKAKDAPKPTPEQARLIEAENQYNNANRAPTALVMKICRGAEA